MEKSIHQPIPSGFEPGGLVPGKETTERSWMPGIEPGVIRTYSGIYFNVINPRIEDIRIVDIAHALSNQCRFSGHTSSFYSVAEHSVRCSHMVLGSRYKLAALLHDASEAYLVDIPTPLKVLMPDYINVEDRLMRIIAEKFGFDYPLHTAVKRIDKLMLEKEWFGLMINKSMATFSAGESKSIFIHEFDRLTK